MVASSEATSLKNGNVPAAEAIDIFKHFGSTVALRGVSLPVRSGRGVGVVGRNGAGNSTPVGGVTV